MNNHLCELCGETTCSDLAQADRTGHPYCCECERKLKMAVRAFERVWAPTDNALSIAEHADMAFDYGEFCGPVLEARREEQFLQTLDRVAAQVGVPTDVLERAFLDKGANEFEHWYERSIRQ